MTSSKIKNHLFTLLVIIFCAIQVNAQTVNADKVVNEAITSIENLSAIKNMIDIRKYIEKDVVKVKLAYNNDKVDQARVEKIKKTYDSIFLEYNGLFDDLKRDLIVDINRTNYNRIQKKYNTKVNSIYEKYQSFHNQTQNVQSDKGIFPVVALIVDIANVILDGIRSKKLNREAIHSAFNSITPLFISKFYMKDCHTLWAGYQSPPQLSSIKAKVPDSSQLILSNAQLSAPYFTEISSNDAVVELYLVNNEQKTLIRQSLKNISSKENIRRLISSKQYLPGSQFSIKVNSFQFVYFFAKNGGNLELLSPRPVTKDTRIETNSNRQKYRYDQSENGLTIPENGFFKIDDKGKTEKWVIAVSKSEIFNPEQFASYYLKMFGDSDKGTIVEENLFVADYKIVDPNTKIKYKISDLVTIYDVTILKSSQ